MSKELEQTPMGSNGKAYWRSLEEYSGTPEFRRWADREFPEGASEFWGDGVSRRSFLRLMGASMALAGVGLSGCRRPEAHMVPFRETPEWMVPGKKVRYASAMPGRRGATPLLVTSFEGRPIKIEGNPLHPLADGGTGTFAQASLLDLYNPYRSQRFLNKGGEVSQAAFEEALAKWRGEWDGTGGEGLAILSDEVMSPTRDRLRGALLAKYPKATWTVYEPLDPGEQAKAQTAAFGPGVRVRPRYDKARVIFSLGADFLGTDEGGVGAVKAFANARRVEKASAKMNRLYMVENRFTVTGGKADHRLRLPVSEMPVFLVNLAKEFLKMGITSPVLVAAVGAAGPLSEPMQMDTAFYKEWIKESAADLAANRGRSVIVGGAMLPAETQVLVYALNDALGNIGKTLSLLEEPAFDGPSIRELASNIIANKVNTLIILGGNPVYDAPADLRWNDLQKQVSNVIHVCLEGNETSEVSGWQVPAAHYLESWGDAICEDGTYLAIQPLILPLYGGFSQIEFLAKMLGMPAAATGLQLVQETFRARFGGVMLESFDKIWRRWVHNGFLKRGKPVSAQRPFNTETASALISQYPVRPTEIGPKNLEVVFAPCYSMDDGRYVDNAWLQELPDPITKLTWENAALMSQKTAEALGVKCDIENGIYVPDFVDITAGGVTISAPILIAHGHADFSVTLPLGWGRKKAGRIGQGTGFDSYPLRTTQHSYARTAVKIAKASVQPSGEDREFAITQEHFSMEGRAIVREAPLDYFRNEPHFVNHVGLEAHSPEIKSFYEEPGLKAEQQWGMSIDLTTCTGCSACIVACQSENNIPVVGKDQVKKGREMLWLRIDRYFSGDDLADPEMLTQPVACMHCENAPCETVCPVNATVHSEDGLNVMVYNRCIGTRYCANNCPYKVRRFNFFDFNQRKPEYYYNPPFSELWGAPSPKGMEETVKMSKNPNVTVRMRGVMEKCTYCVQRIEEAKISTKVEARDSANVKVPADSIKTACQQACAAGAIVFGDIKNPDSRVSKKKQLDHNYKVLGYLNVEPRTSYLARIVNPNEKMPDAKKVGHESIRQMHHAHGTHDAQETHEAHGGSH